MKILELSQIDAKVSVSVTLEDLKSFMSDLVAEASKSQEPEEKYLSVDQATQLLGVTKPTLWRWKKSGILVPSQVGRQIFYRLSDINKLRNNNGHGETDE